MIRIATSATALALLLAPAVAGAHRQWMVPSSTVLSGTDDWVTVDAAVSNELFYFDHQPMRLDAVKAWFPDGSEAKVENGTTGRYRSTFDVHLTQKGTYKIGSANQGIMGSFKVNGTEQRLPRGTRAADVAAAIPAGATDVQLSESAARNEIFVTSGAPTQAVFKPTGQGLELVPVTHPNDVVAGEAARFGFTIDGKPAAGLKLTVMQGGNRYDDSIKPMELTADAQGQVGFTLPKAGMYWLNATAQDANTSVPRATARRLSYVTVIEALQP